MPSRWFIVVRDGRCEACGLRASDVEPTKLGAAIDGAAAAWSPLLRSLGDRRFRYQDQDELAIRARYNEQAWRAVEAGISRQSPRGSRAARRRERRPVASKRHAARG